MRQLLLSKILLNPSVPAEDEKRLSRQAVRIWRLFSNGHGGYQAVRTNRLRIEAAQYNARLNELRVWLRDYGLTIDCVTRDTYGNWKYKVVEFEGSNYQKLLIKRGLA